MAESCVLRLLDPAGGDPASAAGGAEAEWLTVDATGARLAPVARGTLAEAATGAAATRRLVVLVSGADVALASAELPARSHAKQLQLAPYALEEQLAGDVESLHFAIGRPGEQGRVPIAAVEHARLADWLARLRAAGLEPAALLPETLAIPANPGHAVLVLDGGRVLLRRPGALPLALEADPLDTALLLVDLPPRERGQAEHVHVLVYASQPDWDRHRGALESLRDSIGSLKVQLLADGPLPLLAGTVATDAPFSLLQGAFAPRGGLGAQWPRWRVAAALLGAFLALHLLTLGVDGWRLRAAERAADLELRTAATEAMPDVQDLRRLPNLRAAVEARLRAARAAVSDGLLGALGALAVASGRAPGMQIESLNYTGGTTDLTIDAPDLGAIDALQQALVQQGLGAEVQGAQPREQRYQGRLQLRGPAT